MVVTNRGWTKTLVEAHGCGWFTPAGDAPQLAACLRDLLAQPALLQAAGQRGQALARQEFDRQQLAAVVQQALEKAVG